MPGDYSIPFQFHLPMGIPSSIYYKNTFGLKKPKAKVKYTIKTVLHGGDTMKYKQVLIVREIPREEFAQLTQSMENKITTWCCVD